MEIKTLKTLKLSMSSTYFIYAFSSGCFVFPLLYLMSIKCLKRQKLYVFGEVDVFVISERYIVKME